MSEAATDESAFVNESDRLILHGEDLQSAVFYGMEEGTFFDDNHEEKPIPGYLDVEAAIEFVDPGSLNRHLAEEDFYNGIRGMAVVRRKADGKLFGYPYFESLDRHSEGAFYEENGDEHGLGAYPSPIPEGFDWDLDRSVYVWLPVEPFTITGYRIPEATA